MLAASSKQGRALFCAMRSSEKRVAYSASIVELDRVAIGIGEISMRKESPMLASREQPAAELADRCDHAFILVAVCQHVSEVAHSALHTGQIFLKFALRLFHASPRKPESAASRI